MCGARWQMVRCPTFKGEWADRKVERGWGEGVGGEEVCVEEHETRPAVTPAEDGNGAGGGLPLMTNATVVTGQPQCSSQSDAGSRRWS